MPSSHCTCDADGNVHRADCGIVEWNRSDEGQREAVECRAEQERVSPRALLLRWAGEHQRTAEVSEAAAKQARERERACRADAERWYG